MQQRRVLDDHGVRLGDRLAHADRPVVDAAERDDRRAGALRAEGRERLRVPALGERRDREQLGGGDDALAAAPVDAYLEHAAQLRAGPRPAIGKNTRLGCGFAALRRDQAGTGDAAPWVRTASIEADAAPGVEIRPADPERGVDRARRAAGGRRARRRAARPSARSSPAISSSGTPSRCLTSARSELPCAETSTVRPARRSGTIASHQYGSMRARTSFRHSVCGSTSGGSSA